MKALIVFSLLILAACTGATLADRISLNLMQVKAKQNGQYCYTTDAGENFCLVWRKPSGPTIRQAD